jgi:hypothetical protein
VQYPALARLRAQLGARLKVADALERHETRLSSGQIALDAALGGGLPRGRLTEVTGVGRTSLALAAVAENTRDQRIAAWVESMDGFDPRSAERAGVDLRRLLLVRARGSPETLRAADVVLAGGGFDLVVIDRIGIRERAPASAWVRLVRRAETSGACVLALGERPEAGSAATIGLHVRSRASPGGPSLLGRVVACAEIVRAKQSRARVEKVEITLEPPDLWGRER